jgi:hypothetical protein
MYLPNSNIPETINKSQISDSDIKTESPEPYNGGTGEFSNGSERSYRHPNEYFFIRQMPTIAKITGALEMPKKSFLYRLLT